MITAHQGREAVRMRYPSRKALVAAYGQETGAKLRDIFEMDEPTLDGLDCVDTLIRQCHDAPDYLHRLKTALNEAAGTYGVESIGECDMRDGPPILYLNTGDPNATTLIYFRDADAWRIGSWGDLAESRRYQHLFT